eukprot:TRINITY_DN488_c0_g1_i11.p1 TRINITY_DN488_c0_g1~~TRINITY_DN488_c0_g1_i11.p1  ORF type:complete len:196 (+),score=61.84 TRINITY_DN488_c0_g1_i11:218-805(+)
MVALYTKFKYYIGWTMAESAIIASGQSYNGKVDGKHSFDRFYAIEIKAVELGVFAMWVAEGWNHSGHMWLKRYLYFRMNRVINREVALYLTYIISAFWHGFYPMYFVAFVLYSIFTEAHKELYAYCCRHSFMRFPLILTGIYVLSYLGTDYLGMIFDLLLYKHVTTFMSGIYWIPLTNIVPVSYTHLTLPTTPYV